MGELATYPGEVTGKPSYSSCQNGYDCQKHPQCRLPERRHVHRSYYTELRIKIYDYILVQLLYFKIKSFAKIFVYVFPPPPLLDALSIPLHTPIGTSRGVVNLLASGKVPKLLCQLSWPVVG